MPIYEYQCQKCKKVQEIWQKITEDPVKKCPLCGGKLDRLISAVGFELKGGGWYKDGYTSSKKGGSESSSASEGSSASDSSPKSESKADSPSSTSKPDSKVEARAKAEKAEKAQDVRPGKKTDPKHKSNSPKAKN